MTKMKSKKMTKSTFAVIIMAVLMVAMLAFGGTYAYFTASSGEQTGTVNTGTLTIGGTVAFAASDNTLVPNQTITLGSPSTLTVDGTTWAAYRIAFSYTLTKGGSTFTETGDSKFSLDIIGSDNNTVIGSTWSTLTNGYYYYLTVAKGETIGNLGTIAKAFQIKLDKDADDSYQGVTVNYTITVQAAQAEYVEATGNINYDLAETQKTITATEAAKLAWGNSNAPQAPVEDPEVDG